VVGPERTAGLAHALGTGVHDPAERVRLRRRCGTRLVPPDAAQSRAVTDEALLRTVEVPGDGVQGLGHALDRAGLVPRVPQVEGHMPPALPGAGGPEKATGCATASVNEAWTSRSSTR
jgi:hypothetical protein